MSQITYTNKTSLIDRTDINAVNKITAGDMNEIKASVNALYSGSGGAPNLLKQRRTLTEVEIDVLFSSPYLAIAAPGVGKQINIDKIYFELDYGTIPYTNGASSLLKIRINSVDSGDNITQISAGSDRKIISNNIINFGTSAPSFDNQAIYLTSDADFTAGDGVVNLIIYYTIEDVF